MNSFNSISTRFFATTSVTVMTLGLVAVGSQTANAVTFGNTWDNPAACASAGTVSVPTTCSLQDLFNSITVSGGIDAENDTGYETFTNTATGSSIGSFMFEVAGFAPKNKFGIYSLTTGAMAQLFGGVNDAGDRVTVDFNADNSVTVSTKGKTPGYVSATIDQEIANFGNLFGFYLTNGDGETFYSQKSKNGGYQQAAIYRGDNTTNLKLPGKAAGTFTDNEFIIAFEDLWLGGSTDKDYNDLVVMMESIEPYSDVPEPSTLLGLGVLGASFWSVRRRSRS